MSAIKSAAAAAVSALLIASFAVPASAQSVSTRPELTVSQIAEHLTTRGYRVLEVERDDGRYEVKAFNPSGECVEIDVDRRSGDVLRSKRDDDCRADNRRSGRGA